MASEMIRPEKIFFEVTNYCNFKCQFCPSEGLRRPRQHMDYGLFRKGIDEIASQRLTEWVGFHVLGEPMLYANLIEALRYVKSQGLKASINTNGSLLTEERVRELAGAGLDQLNISVQMLGEEEHRCRGSNLPFDDYYRRVLSALRVLRQDGSTMDVILCYMNTSTGKYFDIDKSLGPRWRQDLGRARLLFLILDCYSAIGQTVRRDEVALAVDHLDLLQPKYVRLDGRTAVYVQPMMDWGNAFTQRHIYPTSIGYCGYCLSNLAVLSNGEVAICCGDYEGATSLGNLRDGSLSGMLSSERAGAIASALRKMRLVEPYCQRCFGSPNPVKATLKGLGSIYLFQVLKFQPSGVRQVMLLDGSQ